MHGEFSEFVDDGVAGVIAAVNLTTMSDFSAR